jgi:uracil-DNA glycosylase
MEELEVLQPKAIVTLGRDACISLLGESCWPSLIGKEVHQDTRAIYPFYHPAYVLKLGSVRTGEYVNSLTKILIKYQETHYPSPSTSVDHNLVGS